MWPGARAAPDAQKAVKAALPLVEVRARCHEVEKVCAVELATRSDAAVKAAQEALAAKGFRVVATLESPKDAKVSHPVEIRYERKD